MRASEIIKLYHLSSDANLTMLSPKIPDKLKVRNNAFEDTTISRVSFSESVYGCILGIQLSQDEFTTKTFYIYSPTEYNNSDWVSNHKIIQNKLVFDAHVTREWWGIRDIPVEIVGEVMVTNEIQKTIEYVPLRIGNSSYLKPNGKLDTYLYKSKVTWY